MIRSIAILATLSAALPIAASDLPDPLPGGFKPFTTPMPDSSAQWDDRKKALRAKLWELFGDLPPLFTPQPTIVSRTERDGYTLEKFTFDNGVGDTVYGYVLVPSGHNGQKSRGPAILYNHYHGGQYQQGKEELIIPAFKSFGHGLVTGEELARKGYLVLGIDAYAFGERKEAQGPHKPNGQTEWALYKNFAWQGRNLWGMMVRDDLLALNYLLTRPEVDPARIATMGMSMGSTRSWWVAAMDERIKCIVSVACLTRYQDLIAARGLNYHGIYYFVPGMLREKIDAESVIGLIAPRAHLTLTGDSDDGSPLPGVRKINDFQRELYKLYGMDDNFRGLIYDKTGHVYTAEMWDETLAWLERHL